jgi:hypothetical protein
MFVEEVVTGVDFATIDDDGLSSIGVSDGALRSRVLAKRDELRANGGVLRKTTK